MAERERQETQTGQTPATTRDPAVGAGNGAANRGVHVYDNDTDTTTGTSTTTTRRTTTTGEPVTTTGGGTSWVGVIIGLIVLAVVLYFLFTWVF